MQKGFSIVEVVLVAAMFSVVGLAYSFASIYAHSTATFFDAHSSALALADEGLEAVRNIRDNQYSLLANGTYGLSSSGSVWSLVGSPDVSGAYTRTITIATQTASSKKVTSQVSWLVKGVARSVSADTVLTNLDILRTQAANLTVDTASAIVGGSSNRTISGIALGNIGAASISIDKITVSWTKAGRTINTIVINGSTVWSTSGPGTPAGAQNSGTLIDIQNATLSGGTANIPMTMLFSGSMAGSTMTITFTMTDGSTKTVTFVV